MELHGRKVVITGASQGIGEKLADHFARAGSEVLLIARSVERLAPLAARHRGSYIAADLTDPDQVDGLVDRCIEQLGHIDVWVNNAGMETADAFVHVDRDVIRALSRLNFEATVMLTRDVLPHMINRGEGHIVQMSSVAGAMPFPGLAAYAGTKAGITNFTETLRLEIKGHGVGLTVVAPGPVRTEMWDRLDHPSNWPYASLQRFGQLQFLPKVTADSIAADVLKAVRQGKRHVRPKARFQGYHMLNNAPARAVEAALMGVKSPRLRPERPDAPKWEAIWNTDNPPSRDWPLYTRGNVGEVFPEVVLPLTWQLIGVGAEQGWRDAFEKMGLLMPNDFDGNEDMVILGVFGGYCYINASFVRLLGVRAPGGTVEVIDQQFFGESDAPPYRSAPGHKNPRSSIRLGKTVVRLLRTTDLPALREDKAEVAHYLDRYPGDDVSDDVLLAYFKEIQPLFRRLFARHIDNTFSVALVLGALIDLCAKVDKADSLVSILGGIGDVESSAPSSAMWKLARKAQANPTVAAAFDAGTTGVLSKLEAETEAKVWLVDFADFLDRFGSRGPNEWDLGSDPWAFRPELALAAVDRMRTADEDHDPDQQARRLARQRREAVAEIRGLLNPADRFQFDKALRATTLYSQGRERSKTTIITAVHGARIAQRELARRIAERGGPTERWHTCLYSLDEFRQALTDPKPLNDAIAERVKLHGTLSDLVPPFILEGEVPDPSTWASRKDKTAAITTGESIQGIAGCPGTARGRARVVLDPAAPGDLGPGDVLVAPITDPSWTPLFLAANAVVVDVGATMSHAVIVSRELGIPCVVSAVGATQRIPDGATIEVDGSTGMVTVVDAG